MALSWLTLATLTLLAAGLVPVLLMPSASLHWLRRKKHQYEVTLALNMLTAVERFILNSIFFIILSLFVIAAALYLPEHMAHMARRASYYYHGSSLSTLSSHRVAALDTLSNALLYVRAPGGLGSDASKKMAAAATATTAVQASVREAVSTAESVLAAAGTAVAKVLAGEA